MKASCQGRKPCTEHLRQRRGALTCLTCIYSGANLKNSNAARLEGVGNCAKVCGQVVLANRFDHLAADDLVKGAICRQIAVVAKR